MATSVAGNSVTWSYAGYNNHPSDPSSTVQLLFTITASDQPFADGLFLTNQAQFTNQTTNATDATANATNQIQLQEPLIAAIAKGVVATNGATAVLSPVTAGPVTFNAPGTAGARWTGTVQSTNLGSTPINSNVTGLQKGDLVTFALVLQNTGSSPNGAFDVKIRDDLPAGFVVPAGGLNVRVADGANAALGFTDLGGGLLGSGIELTDGATGAIKASHATSGQNVAVVTYDLEVATTVAAGQTITNTGTLFGYSGTDSGPTFTTGRTDTATATTGVFVAAKSVVTTSEAFTTTGVAIGEVVRYRLQLQVPETGLLTNVQLFDALPNGITYLDDSTAKVMLVTNNTGMTSTGTNALSDAGLVKTGNAANVAALTPTFVLPDANVSSDEATDVDNNYTSGRDIFFNLGSLTNSDGDADAEFAVVEFNAIIDNTTNGAVPRNLIGNTRDNAFTSRVNNVVNGAGSSNATVTVQTPELTLTKTTTTGLINAGDTVSYRLVLANSNNANATTGYELTLSDALPAGLTLNAGSITSTPSGTVGAVVNTSAGNTVSFTVASLAKNSSLTIDFTAASATSLTPGQVLANTATYTSTSLAGTNGTTGNATGSDTPGVPGAITGERTGTGTNPNLLNGSGAVNVTVYSSTLSGTVYTDLNNNGVFDGGDTGVAGKTVTLTGTDHLGTVVNLPATTNASGVYTFGPLRGGTYTITKAAAVKAWEGTATVGTQASGTAAAPAISSISIPIGTGITGTGNNIGELLRADLSVVKTVAQPLYVLGQNVSYTLTLANAGPSDATSTVVTDTLPGEHDLRLGDAEPGDVRTPRRSRHLQPRHLRDRHDADDRRRRHPDRRPARSPTRTSITSGVVDQALGNNSSSVDTNVESLNPTKSLVSTSESSTSGADLAIGEVARYRLVVTLPEVPTLVDFQLHDQLPAGLTFLDDGTATVAFVSDAGGITSSTVVPGLLPDAAVSSLSATDLDTYVNARTSTSSSATSRTGRRRQRQPGVRDRRAERRREQRRGLDGRHRDLERLPAPGERRRARPGLERGRGHDPCAEPDDVEARLERDRRRRRHAHVHGHLHERQRRRRRDRLRRPPHRHPSGRLHAQPGQRRSHPQRRRGRADQRLGRQHGRPDRRHAAAGRERRRHLRRDPEHIGRPRPGPDEHRVDDLDDAARERHDAERDRLDRGGSGRHDGRAHRRRRRQQPERIRARRPSRSTARPSRGRSISTSTTPARATPATPLSSARRSP